MLLVHSCWAGVHASRRTCLMDIAPPNPFRLTSGEPHLCLCAPQQWRQNTWDAIFGPNGAITVSGSSHTHMNTRIASTSQSPLLLSTVVPPCPRFPHGTSRHYMIETTFTLTPGVKRPVRMRAPLPPGRPPVAPRVQHRMVRGTQHNHTIIVGNVRSAFRDRNDVVQLEIAPAVSCQVKERAFSVVRDDARAEIPPRLSVVQIRHVRSPTNMLAITVAIKPGLCAAFTKFSL